MSILEEETEPIQIKLQQVHEADWLTAVHLSFLHIISPCRLVSLHFPAERGPSVLQPEESSSTS